MHTPGPWKYVEQKCHGSDDTYPIVKGDGFVIVNGVAPGGIPDEARANARLIAAAPELLEVCKYICKAWNDGMQIGSPHVRSAASAIVKAEGKS